MESYKSVNQNNIVCMNGIFIGNNFKSGISFLGDTWILIMMSLKII